jgi:tetratricopeptide (TPR) repeat protein
LKSFHKDSHKPLIALLGAVFTIFAAGWVATASGALPAWLRNIEGRTELEAAFFRLMTLPGGEVTFRRPPSETRPALGDLLKKQPENAELYALRALEDEQQLDFTAAEADWKSSGEKASEKCAAQLSLADFYHRRLQPLDEIKALSAVAGAPPDPSEKLTPASEQRSWRAFERIFGVIRRQGLPAEVSVAQYRSWLARYPQEPSLYPRFLEYLIAINDFSAATQLIAQYHEKFPADEILPVKARALVEYRQGSLQQGLAVYEKAFQPLWAPELIKSYFDLLTETHSLRKFLDEAKAAQQANPEDLKAAARIFYYYQQQGKLDAAQETIAKFRLRKDTSGAHWSAEELYVSARLLEEIHAYPESARFYFALYNSKGMNNAAERALGGLAHLLLTAPETPIRFGAGELSMYRDIATMDQGPGYLNGILSLLLNTTSPANEFSGEEDRAVSYFHRSRAAELVTLLDTKFPNSPRRAELHSAILEFYAASGESQAVIKGGKEFLANFPNASSRTAVALLMADAYSRTGKPREEFAIYDSVLRELASKADRIPLGSRDAEAEIDSPEGDRVEEGGESEGEDAQYGAMPRRAAGQRSSAFQVNAASASAETGARSPEYARVLERYLARLVELQEIPQALGVLRRELDHNPDDPGLYERLAVFLDQNRLGVEQEEIYRRAMARFPDRSWYHKLARLYLHQKKTAEFEKLTQDAVRIFQGSELEHYFQSLVGGQAEMYLRLNLYANRRFPHNPVFVRNLLTAYQRVETHDEAAWEAVLRQHWFEEPDLRNRFFEFLTRTGRLDAEIKSLEQDAPSEGKQHWSEFVRQNPAAGQYLAQAYLWRSHFEESAPVLESLAEEYPADVELGQTASSVFRSLAYFDPGATSAAVKIEDHLLAANPGNTQNLARIGDIYADRELFAKAGPYWERIPRVSPSEAGGYLEAATIYWDYFDFDNAMRLLAEGRARLSDDSLYAYEAGAIYEGKRDYPRAVEEYVKGALAAGEQSPAESRLLALATRPKFRDLVDRETQKPAGASGAPLSAVVLRVRVLEAQNRQPEIVSLLDSVASGATTIEQAAEIENLAQQKSLEAVRQHALEKQASLASDPVTRLQLRYTLARLYESRKDFAAAERNVESLYHDNPNILGVVRSTAEFYWRMKRYPQAIAVLQQAAKDAYPELGKQFAFEAARKSAEARLFPQAREILAQLLKDSPYDSQYLAAVADSYAQSGDQQGLKQFYLEKITLFRSAALSADDRKARIAALRRGLIPALTRLDDYAGAIDQYIEIINVFPEDENVVTEAALYAVRHKRQRQLVDYYVKTIQQSPRDYRWSMVLARIETSLEDFPGAIETYAKAITIRPDRGDLRIARAGLAERMMRFDEAIGEYDRVYQLSYKDPKWMEKIAEIRARQGKTDDAVAALKTALIDGRPEKAENFFEVARRLESWGLLTEARGFAEQGVTSLGAELLASTDNHAGAKLYTRILTRLRQQETAYATLQNAYSGASSSLPVIKEQIAKEGISAAKDSEWRQRQKEIRMENAREGMHLALMEMGSSAERYFTPEEKRSFAQFAEKLRGSMTAQDLVDRFAIPLAESGGLAEKEAAWRYESLMTESKLPQQLIADMNTYVDLERRRLTLADLGPQLERFAPRLNGNRSVGLIAAAQAYRAVGDEENELRVLGSVGPEYLGGENQKQWFTLLLTHRPEQLVEIAATWTAWGQQAADFVVANGDAALVHAVVAARGRVRPPVWSKSYDALAGLYLAEPPPNTNKAFIRALGDNTVGERLGKPVDRNAQLAGDIWFYYGSRYGEYLGATKQGTPEDYLSAVLEQSPATAAGYLALADYYSESGDTHSAISDYNHALELTPGHGDVLDRLALAYFMQGSRSEALAQWKLALTTLTRQIATGRVPESFWTDFRSICEHLETRRLFAPLKPDADTLLRAYLHRNGNYRSNALLRSAYLATAEPASATPWLLDLASAAPDPTQVLADIADARWIPLAQRAPIYQRILGNKQDAFSRAEGFQKENAQEELRSWQVLWVKYLIQTKQFSRADDYLAALSVEAQRARAATLVPFELQAAAQMGTLDAKIAGYRANSSLAPSPEILRAAARQLFDAGDKQSARKLTEFVFAREIENHQLVASNFLGLAEIRIAAGDTAGALELLRRLVVVVGNPYENLDPAAALLEKTGHGAEAVEFLDQLVKSAPWQASYRLRLAKARLVAKDRNSSVDALTKIASSSEAAYNVRVEAAIALAGAQTAADLGSAELEILSSGPHAISTVVADQPFFYEARLKAAENATGAHAKLEPLGKALADSPARGEARIPLFKAAESFHSDRLALLAIEPLLREQLLERGSPAESNEEEIVSSGDTETDASDEEGPTETYEAAKMSPAERAQISLAVANALVRLDRWSEALPYLEVAQRLEKAPARRKEVIGKLAEVRTMLRRERLNLARQPILHQELEQSRVVRPRLVARAATPAKASAKGGEKP